MGMAWKDEGNRLVCRWPEVGQSLRYSAPWMQEPETLTESPSFLDFTTHSALGGRRWLEAEPGYGRE